MTWAAPDRLWPHLVAFMQETRRRDFATTEWARYLEHNAAEFRDNRPGRWSLRIQLGASGGNAQGSLAGFLQSVLRAFRIRGLLIYDKHTSLWSLR